MDWSVLKDLIASVGFPILISAYLLFREDKRLRTIQDILNQILECVQKK